MRYLLSIIFFFSLSVKAEPIKVYGSVLNCKNIDWIIDRMSDFNFRLLDENKLLADEICIMGRNVCKSNIESSSTNSNSILKYSSLIGYAFTFHKPVCNNEVNYINAAKYYAEALKMPVSGVSKDSTNVKNSFTYFGKLTTLIEDAASNKISKKELSSLLEILELLILNYGFEDKNYNSTDDYIKYVDFLDNLWLGDNVIPVSFTINWLKRAADCGWGIAQYDLGMTLLSGRLSAEPGGKQTIVNHVEAYKWLLLAKQAGYPVPQPYLNSSKERLSSQQLTEAQDRAYNWQERCPTT